MLLLTQVVKHLTGNNGHLGLFRQMRVLLVDSDPHGCKHHGVVARLLGHLLATLEDGVGAVAKVEGEGLEELLGVLILGVSRAERRQPARGQHLVQTRRLLFPKGLVGVAGVIGVGDLVNLGHVGQKVGAGLEAKDEGCDEVKGQGPGQTQHAKGLALFGEVGHERQQTSIDDLLREDRQVRRVLHKGLGVDTGNAASTGCMLTTKQSCKGVFDTMKWSDSLPMVLMHDNRTMPEC
jgi:hypothetical protein